jgi:hypothetical protein
VDKKLIPKWQGHQDGGQLIMDTYTEVFGGDDAQYEQQQLAKLGVQRITDSLAIGIAVTNDGEFRGYRSVARPSRSQ